jgi:hypothetical protein
VALVGHPIPHRAVGRHAFVAADVDQAAATAQFCEDSFRGFNRVARRAADHGVTGFARLAVGRGKAVMIVVDPALHGAGGRHAGLVAQQAQRVASAQPIQNAFGQFGGIARRARHG